MGGSAFKNTKSIRLEHIYDTLKWLSNQNTDIAALDMWGNRLGSSVHKNICGDIDINIDSSKYNQVTLSKILSNILGDSNVKNMPDIIMTSVPISGDEESFGRVQVDFMIGNAKWQSFAYQSSTSSEYKGIYRTILLKALTAYNSDWVLEENDEVVAIVGPTFLLNKGCVWRYRYRPINLRTNKRVKDFKELSEKDFLKIYPSAIKTSKSIITNPSDFFKFIGSNLENYHCDSYESLWRYIRGYYGFKEISRIKKIFLNLLNNAKIDIPTGIQQDFLRY